MKIAVIVTDFGAAANVGGDVERICRSFDIQPEMASYIEAKRHQWSTVAFAIVDEEPRK